MRSRLGFSSASACAALVLASLASVSGTAHAYPTYPNLVPNPRMALGSTGLQQACITCHNNPDGGTGCVGHPEYPQVTSCLNPFGMAFKPYVMAGQNWNPTLAQQDADGDGFTNGEELQDPLGTWTPGTPAPGNGAYATRPGFPEDNPGKHDVDMDGWCWVGQDMNGDHDCLDANETGLSVTQGDCDDGNPGAHPGATEICTNTADDDCNGLDTFHDPVCMNIVDADGDGYCPGGQDMNGDRDCLDAGEMTSAVDCDDTRVLVNPGVFEICANGLDDDCDGSIDMMDSDCSPGVDNDSDFYCPIGQDLNQNHRCDDSAAEMSGPSDCNDRQSTVHPGAAEVCGNTLDDDCDGLADFADSDCASVADGDHDGYCPNGIDSNHDGDCVDSGEQGAASDCNDSDASIHPGATEICTDNIDQNCDGQPALGDPTCAGYLDTDHDQYCAVGIDKNNDHDCADTGEIQPFIDCDDTRASVHFGATEVCTNGLDDDCDGSVDAADPSCVDYRDSDFDKYCVIGVDMNADGDCADAGEQPSGGVADAAPDDPTVYPGAPENCIDGLDNDQDGTTDLGDADCSNSVDVDGDGYCPYGRDLNHNGNCSDTNENYRVSDCDDHSATINPDAIESYIEGAMPEPCFDHRDNDCDGQPDMWDTGCEYVYDYDRDGYCVHGIDGNRDGDCLDIDEQLYGVDCNDQMASVNPSAIENCSDGIDDDCDGKIDAFDSDCPCTADVQCSGAGMCELNVCMSGTCQKAADPACMAAKSSSGCNASSTGSDALPMVWLLLVALASVAFARRNGRAGTSRPR